MVTDILSDAQKRNERCPACGTAIEPGTSGQSATAQCPRCGQRLWLVREHPGDQLVIKLECTGTRPAHLDEIINQIPKGAGSVDLALDFQDVRGIYSADLAKMISLKKVIDATGGHLTIRHLHADVRDIFRITRLDEVFRIEA